MRSQARVGKLQKSLPNEIDRNLERLEGELRSRGVSVCAGLDEAGRGCLAGPVVAAAVILPLEVFIPGIRDSKLLTPQARERLYDAIMRQAQAVAVARVEAPEIDRINILQASLRAMKLAVEQLSFTPEHLLIDGLQTIASPLPQTAVVHGDRVCRVIAAASIIAKVTRDRLMVDFERDYPQFRFSLHKGYGTKQHLDELRVHGPSPLHRRTFRGVCT